MYLLNEGVLTVKYITQTEAGENILQNRREYYSTLFHSEKCGCNALDMFQKGISPFNILLWEAFSLPFFLLTRYLVTSYSAKYHDAAAAAKPWLKPYA